MENYVITIYCFIDDFVKISRKKDESLRKTTDAEILTTAIIASRYFGCNMVKARGYMRSHHGVVFIDKSGFNRRLHGLEFLLWSLFRGLGQRIKNLNISSEYIIDSFPVKVCHNIRIPNCKLLKNKAYRGKCVSKREYFYGFKVQLVVDANGIPVDYYIAAGSFSDITAFKSMNLDLPVDSTLYADAIYNDYQYEDLLMECDQIHLLVQRKSNLKRQHKPYTDYLIENKRKRIETTFSEIAQMMPAKIHAVTPQGFLIKIFLFVLAYTFFRSINL